MNEAVASRRVRLTGTPGKVGNFVGFEAGWLILVVWPGAWTFALGLALVLLHLRLISAAPLAEARFVLVAVVLGSLMDGIWFASGVLGDAAGSLWTPYWLMAIWALFSTALAHSLAWCHNYPRLTWLMGGLAGPFAYWAAHRLGAIELGFGLWSLVIMGAGWAVLFPALLRIQRRFFPEVLA